MRTRTLYRPVGLKELVMIAQSGWKSFPPRLAWQPIFYPVLSQEYAAQIAGEWNTNDAFSGDFGAVTAFEIAADFCTAYPVQNVGGNGHDELWIPAEELEAFNRNIIGSIKVVQAFFGAGFQMPEAESVRTVLSKLKEDDDV